MTDRITLPQLILPWPSPLLNANARVHWHKRSTATRKARSDAFYAAREVLRQPIPNAVLSFTWCPPDRRRRDVQNLPGMMKAYIDGLADAMGCDDHGFRPRFPDGFADPVKGGAVIITVSEAT